MLKTMAQADFNRGKGAWRLRGWGKLRGLAGLELPGEAASERLCSIFTNRGQPYECVYGVSDAFCAIGGNVTMQRLMMGRQMSAKPAALAMRGRVNDLNIRKRHQVICS